MLANHRPEFRINKELSVINKGTNIHNIHSEVIDGNQNLFAILGTINVSANAQNINNAGHTFQIRLELPQIYPFSAPLIYVNGQILNFIDVIGYHINLEYNGLHYWTEYAGNSPLLNVDRDNYFSGNLQPEENGWMYWSPSITLETTFNIIQYMLERAGPPPLRRERCNINFTIIPILPPNEVAHLDLSEDVCPITLSEFITGKEYYMITKVVPQLNSPDVTNYTFCDKEGLQTWLMQSVMTRCKHPALLNIVVEQNDIRRFIYNGPVHVGSGSISKRKSRLLKKKKRKSRK
jgi:ubiquitin-protein ligase